MSEIIPKALQFSIVENIEINLAEYSFFLGKLKDAQVYDGPEVKWVFTNGPIFNRVFNARFTAPQLNTTLSQVLAPFKATKTPVTWLTGPSTYPQSLGENLASNGLTYRGEWAGMALNLENLPPTYPLPAGLQIQRVSDQATLRDWIAVACTGFQFPASITQVYYDTFLNLNLDETQPWQLYLALLDGEPVATCTLFTGSATAGIYWTATLPNLRHRGIAAALTWHLLCQAKEVGYPLAVLHSTAVGLPVYTRLGFREYCKIGIYTWDARSLLRRGLGRIRAYLHS